MAYFKYLTLPFVSILATGCGSTIDGSYSYSALRCDGVTTASLFTAPTKIVLEINGDTGAIHYTDETDCTKTQEIDIEHSDSNFISFSTRNGGMQCREGVCAGTAFGAANLACDSQDVLGVTEFLYAIDGDNLTLFVMGDNSAGSCPGQEEVYVYSK